MIRVAVMLFVDTLPFVPQPRCRPWTPRQHGHLLHWRSWRQSSERRRTAWWRCTAATSWQFTCPPSPRPKKCAGSLRQTAMTSALAYISTGLPSRAGPSLCTSASRVTTKRKRRSWKVSRCFQIQNWKQPKFSSQVWACFKPFSLDVSIMHLYINCISHSVSTKLIIIASLCVFLQLGSEAVCWLCGLCAFCGRSRQQRRRWEGLQNPNQLKPGRNPTCVPPGQSHGRPRGEPRFSGWRHVPPEVW